LLLQTYESVVRPRSAIYCSAPITSGRRYLQWLTSQQGRQVIDDLSEADKRLHQQQVIEPNKSHAREVADRLRQRTNKPVIDPTVVGPIDRWRQADWIAFWEDVIARFAFEIALVDGWEYSYGCTHEFWFAHSRGLTNRDEAGNPLTPAEGVRRIQAAIAELKQARADTSKLDRVVELLRRIGS